MQKLRISSDSGGAHWNFWKVVCPLRSVCGQNESFRADLSGGYFSCFDLVVELCSTDFERLTKLIDCICIQRCFGFHLQCSLFVCALAHTSVKARPTSKAATPRSRAFRITLLELSASWLEREPRGDHVRCGDIARPPGLRQSELVHFDCRHRESTHPTVWGLHNS